MIESFARFSFLHRMFQKKREFWYTRHMKLTRNYTYARIVKTDSKERLVTVCQLCQRVRHLQRRALHCRLVLR